MADIHESNILYTFGSPHGLRDALNSKKHYMTYENDKFFLAKLSRRLIMQDRTDFRTLPFANNTQGLDAVTFGFKSNNFTKFLMSQLTSSNKGVKLKSLYSDYKKASNSNINKEEFSNLLGEFYNFVKDTEVFLLKKDNVPQFPKTAVINLFKISTVKM